MFPPSEVFILHETFWHVRRYEYFSVTFSFVYSPEEKKMTKHPCLFGQPTGYTHKDPRFIVKVMDILLQITWEASVQFSNSFEILPTPTF